MADASKPQGVIALIVGTLTNPFFGELWNGVRDEAVSEGYLPVLADCALDPAAQRDMARRLVGLGVQGLIVTIPHDPEVLRLPVPLVAVDRVSGGVPYVAIDGRTGGRMAVRHLARSGYRRIGILVAGPELVPVADRVAGWSLGLREHGLSEDERWKVICGSFAPEDVAVGARRLIDAGVDAVFCINDTMAATVLMVLNQMGRRVSDDVAVVGYDDTPMAAWPMIGLTSVSQSTTEVGRTAARMLFQRMSSATLAITPTILTPTLMIRQSSRGPATVAGSTQ